MRSTRLASRALAVLTLAASALVGAASVAGATAAAATAPTVRSAVRNADEAADTPLRVTMTRLTPSTIPQRGRIMISGVVENVSEEDWSDINVSPFISAEPLTTRDEL
ncbi:MAG: hypothetical protein ABWY19_08435, partial [Marmoricola sp.]